MGAGLTSTLTLICLGIGLILLVVEMFTPGLGAAGALGALALLGAVLLQIGNPIGILFMIALVLFIVAIALLLFLGLGTKGKFDKSKLILKDSIESASNEFERPDYQALVGKTGVAETILRPSGKAMVDGKLLDVTTEGEFILKGREIEIAFVEGLRIVVRPVVSEA